MTELEVVLAVMIVYEAALPGRGFAGSMLTCAALEAEDTERKSGEMINCQESRRK
jgi:hypothetical protein